MAQAIGEEDAVSERLTQRKRRKRKTKKHSSKPSETDYIHVHVHVTCMCPDSTSASLEKLTDIGDVEAGSPVASSQAEPTPDSTQGVPYVQVYNVYVHVHILYNVKSTHIYACTQCMYKYVHV